MGLRVWDAFHGMTNQDGWPAGLLERGDPFILLKTTDTQPEHHIPLSCLPTFFGQHDALFYTYLFFSSTRR